MLFIIVCNWKAGRDVSLLGETFIIA